MGIGLGIMLLVVGAILTFTGLDESYLDTSLDTVGWILMGGGALALIMGVIQNAQRTRHTVVEERRGGPDVIERRGGPDVIERRDDPRV
ncbi:hypothetical protein FNH13_02280 [Ornithinimicrobium ciconiae]|uniref:DUF6458 domain-containing protein n=1 Tax=Ornithinimicrobium ciconiae TaxID=2594265 RepID=A0A516G753_9MICO|nr:DUF6458 family protein [Ornithinimicrobium ciconiae]QDO87302.1 hypothetical protein FNH13_02280 [Ornithinimicrobium ciconiae]